MLAVKKLVKNFDNVTVLKGLELEILPRERVALVGQNGCGKTTLIRCLLGLYQFDGEIEIFGSSIKKEREAALMKIAFVPQSPPPLKNTVREIISLTAHLCQFPEVRIEEMAGQLSLNISQCLSTPFKNLSGGMKQKLLIACALARRPSLLIMDEPSANLDPQARAVFFRLLSELPEETTMLLTSHRVDELSGIVTRVIELDDGKITMDDVVEAREKDVLTGQHACTLQLKKIPASVRSALLSWSFIAQDECELNWSGLIASADSFRFHASLTRWSGIINEVTLKKIKNKECKSEGPLKFNLASTSINSLCLPADRRNETAGTIVGERTLCPLQDDTK